VVEQLIVVSLMMAVAAAVQGATGFGFGLVSIALIGTIMDAKQASVIIVLVSLGLYVVLLWKLRAHFSWTGLAPVLVGVVVAAPLGVCFLREADHRVFTFTLGILLIASVLSNLLRGSSTTTWHTFYAGFPCGVFSGLLTGAFSTGGPPLVAFLSTQKHGKLRYSASMQVLLAAGTTVRALELGRTGWITREVLLHSAVASVFMAAGALAGLKVLHIIPDRSLATAINMFLLVMGIRYLAWS